MYFYKRVFGLYITLDLLLKDLLFINYFNYNLLILSFIILLFYGAILIS